MALSNSSRPPAPRVGEVVVLACVSAAMYRLQHVGDPLMIVWAAGAIIILTGALTVARAVERGLSRVFGLTSPDDEDADEE